MVLTLILSWSKQPESYDGAAGALRGGDAATAGDQESLGLGGDAGGVGCSPGPVG